jgi:hypothetical protein
MRAVLAGLAVEGLQIEVAAKRGPPFGLHPRPRKAQDLGDGGLEVVVADLAGRYPTEHTQRVHVALEERLLPAGRKDPSPY